MFHECRHIKTNGLRCHGAALRGKPYCYFHMNLRRVHNPRLPDSQAQFPPIEDSSSILLAIGQAIRTLNSPYADTRRTGQILYALQIAARLTTRKADEEPSKSVRTLHNPAGDQVDFSHALDNGIEILAPDTTVCEPPHDCLHCRKQESCVNYQEPDEDEEDEEEEEEEIREDDDQFEEEEQAENDEDEPEESDPDQSDPDQSDQDQSDPDDNSDEDQNPDEDEDEDNDDDDDDDNLGKLCGNDPDLKAALRVLHKDSPRIFPKKRSS